MSRIVGIIRQSASSSLPEISGLQSDKCLRTADYLISWQIDNPNSLKTGYLSEGELYLVLGFPLLMENERYVCPTDWASILSSEAKIRSLEGHYLIIIASQNKVLVFNDRLGKRSLYMRRKDGWLQFCTDLESVKSIWKPSIDFEKLGPWWQSKLPHHRFHYSPTYDHYYQDVFLLPPAGRAELYPQFKLEDQPYVPSPSTKDLQALVSSCALAPLEAGYKVALSFSAGMDMRALLAVYLGAGYKPVAYYNGNATQDDYIIARRIAKYEGFELKRVDPAESWGADPWNLLCAEKARLDIFANPLLANYYGFCGIIAQSSELMVSGYFGEILRYKYMVPHMLSNFRSPRASRLSLLSYLNNRPPRIFIPPIDQIMQQSFEDQLNTAIAQMSAQRGNMAWLDLFACRYSFLTNTMTKVSRLDNMLIDHMPFMQASILDKRWSMSSIQRLNESLHRGLIARYRPSLQNYPLVGASTAPYYYRQYMIKAKWALTRKHEIASDPYSPFFARHRDQIMDLLGSARVQNFEAYDLPLIKDAVIQAFEGNRAQQIRSLIWLSFELGR